VIPTETISPVMPDRSSVRPADVAPSSEMIAYIRAPVLTRPSTTTTPRAL